MSSLTLVILLQIVGVFVVIVEFIIPSFGILSVMAACIVGYSLYVAYAVSPGTGLFFTVADVILLPVLVIVGLKVLAKSPVTLRKELSSKNGVTSQTPGKEDYLGMEGSAVTDLRPAGTALIKNKRVDVVSRGEYIEKGTAILVIDVTGNQIIVKPRP